MSLKSSTGASRHPLSQALDEAYYRGALDGLLAFFAATGFSILGHRYVPFYRGFNLPAKGIFVTSIAVSTSVIQAERYMEKAYKRFQQTSDKDTEADKTFRLSDQNLSGGKGIQNEKGLESTPYDASSPYNQALGFILSRESLGNAHIHFIRK